MDLVKAQVRGGYYLLEVDVAMRDLDGNPTSVIVQSWLTQIATTTNPAEAKVFSDEELKIAGNRAGYYILGTIAQYATKGGRYNLL